MQERSGALRPARRAGMLRAERRWHGLGLPPGEAHRRSGFPHCVCRDGSYAGRSHMVKDFLARYGYAAVFIGTAFEGETVLVAAGFAAHRGIFFPLPWVIAAAFVGSFGADQFFFFLGRRYGKRLVARWPRWRARIAHVNRRIERYSTLFILGFRFLYGLRTVSPLALGLTRVPVGRFILLNACGAAVWAATFGTAGYLFGAVIQAYLGRIERHEEAILAIIAGTGAVAWGIHHVASKRQRLPAALTPTRDSPWVQSRS